METSIKLPVREWDFQILICTYHINSHWKVPVHIATLNSGKYILNSAIFYTRVAHILKKPHPFNATASYFHIVKKCLMCIMKPGHFCISLVIGGGNTLIFV